MAASEALPGADRPVLEVRHKGLLTIAVMAATLLQVLDSTIANVALPHMQASLGATQDTISWVLTSYIVASAIAIPITGWLADQIGMRRLFLGSVVGFIVASMLCGIAVNLPEMVAFRLIQGISGAFIGPLSQSMMLDINPPSRHPKAMALYGQGVMVGPIIGPIIGGWLTENFDWRWVFYVNVPIGIACLILLFTLLPHKPRMKRDFDVFGFALLAIALAALQLMLDRGEHEDWFSSAEICIEAGIAVSFLWMFVVHLFTARKPIYNKELLSDQNLMAALFFMFMIGLVAVAALALVPSFLQTLLGYPVIDTGWLVSTRGVGVILSMWFVGVLAHRLDARVMIIAGFAAMAGSLVMMTGWSLDMDWRPVVITGFVQGLGIGLVFVPLAIMSFATLDAKFRTEAASLTNLMRNLGGSIGITVMTAMLARNTQVSHSDLAQHITTTALPIDGSAAQGIYGLGDGLMTMINGEVSRQAAMIAYLDDFKLMLLATLCTMPLVLLLRKAKRPPTAEDMIIGE